MKKVELHHELLSFSQQVEAERANYLNDPVSFGDIIDTLRAQGPALEEALMNLINADNKPAERHFAAFKLQHLLEAQMLVLTFAAARRAEEEEKEHA